MSSLNVLGLCNLQYSPHLGDVTSGRPLGVVSFLSRYALMDFPLSNFSNSGIDKIAILCRQHPQSVLQHIGNGTSWNSNTKTGFLTLMYNESGNQNQRFNTDIANIKENEWVIKKANPDYIISAPAHVICSINFKDYIEAHIEKGCDVSVIYTNSKNLKEEFHSNQILTINKEGLVTGSKENVRNIATGNVSLGIFIINRATLDTVLRESENVSLLYGLSDMLRFLNTEKRITVYAQKYKGYVRQVNSLAQYFDVSLELLDHKKRDQLFFDGEPIYTTTHDTPPSRYGSRARVTNSFIANGATVNGNIENSIISRNVVINKDAKIKNCIVFSGVTIGPGVELENVIVDKSTVIGNKKKLIGHPNEPVYIKQGAKI